MASNRDRKPTSPAVQRGILRVLGGPLHEITDREPASPLARQASELAALAGILRHELRRAELDAEVDEQRRHRIDDLMALLTDQGRGVPALLRRATLGELEASVKPEHSGDHSDGR